jgi:hypothetical protein
VIVKNHGGKKSQGAISDGEKKVCLWPIGAGTTCGKTFTKFDSLKRHLAETHKGKEVGDYLFCLQVMSSSAILPMANVYFGQW